MNPGFDYQTEAGKFIAAGCGLKHLEIVSHLTGFMVRSEYGAWAECGALGAKQQFFTIAPRYCLRFGSGGDYFSQGGNLGVGCYFSNNKYSPASGPWLWRRPTAGEDGYNREIDSVPFITMIRRP